MVKSIRRVRKIKKSVPKAGIASNFKKFGSSLSDKVKQSFNKVKQSVNKGKDEVPTSSEVPKAGIASNFKSLAKNPMLKNIAKSFKNEVEKHGKELGQKITKDIPTLVSKATEAISKKIDKVVQQPVPSSYIRKRKVKSFRKIRKSKK